MVYLAEAQRQFGWGSPIRLDSPAFEFKRDRQSIDSVLGLYLPYVFVSGPISDLHGPSAHDWGKQQTDSLHRVYREQHDRIEIKKYGK